MTHNSREFKELAEAYAKQSYLVSEENHPEEDKVTALNNLVEYHHQELQKAKIHELEVLTVHLDRQLAGYSSVNLDSIYRYIEERQKWLHSELGQPNK